MEDSDLRKYIKKALNEIIESKIIPLFKNLMDDYNAMLRESESRIAATNRIVESLTQTCKACAELYNKQISQASEERRQVDKVNEELVAANRELLRQLEENRKTFDAICQDYKQRLEDSVRHNQALVTSYIKLAENKISNTEINIGSDNNYG